jgi:hypothetical protein
MKSKTFSPFLKTNTLGILETSYFSANSSHSSTSILIKKYPFSLVFFSISGANFFHLFKFYILLFYIKNIIIFMNQ